MQRPCTHIRSIFLLIIVLNTLERRDGINKSKIAHAKRFEEDIQYCHKCFETQIQHCSIIFDEIESVEELSMRQLLTFFGNSLSKRNNQLIKLKDSKDDEMLISKYLFQKKKTTKSISKIDELKRNFLQQQEILEGMQYFPLNTLDKFIKSLQNFHRNLSEVAIYNYLLNNIQPLILPILYENNFPVPKTHAVCGFTLYQEYAGKSLYNFFKTDFYTKLEIAKQLLQAVITFSHGFNNYRLYITDLTADNVAYDEANKQLHFVDLDTILIVDSTEAKYKSTIHKHFYIECSGCFAYISDDIASYNISDINIYSACQFLREDLHKDQSKGFLHPIPEKFISSNSKLWLLLNKCVDCPDNLCVDRFMVAKEIIQGIEEILK